METSSAVSIMPQQGLKFISTPRHRTTEEMITCGRLMELGIKGLIRLVQDLSGPLGEYEDVVESVRAELGRLIEKWERHKDMLRRQQEQVVAGM